MITQNRNQPISVEFRGCFPNAEPHAKKKDCFELNSGDVLANEDEVAKMRKEETNMFTDDVVIKCVKEVVTEAE